MAEKFTHAEVAYEHPAKGPHHCSQCSHWEGFGCEIVVSPIKPQDWCKKFHAKRISESEAAHIRQKAGL